MITGSRDVNREAARALFEQHLSPFVSQGRTWLLGTARGVDQWAMEWLLENSETCWAVVPYTRFKQPQWIQATLDEMDRVVELQLPGAKLPAPFATVTWWTWRRSCLVSGLVRLGSL